VPFPTCAFVRSPCRSTVAATLIPTPLPFTTTVSVSFYVLPLNVLLFTFVWVFVRSTVPSYSTVLRSPGGRYTVPFVPPSTVRSPFVTVLFTFVYLVVHLVIPLRSTRFTTVLRSFCVTTTCVHVAGRLVVRSHLLPFWFVPFRSGRSFGPGSGPVLFCSFCSFVLPPFCVPAFSAPFCHLHTFCIHVSLVLPFSAPRSF